MRTVMVDIKQNHPAVSYFEKNTTGSRAVRNTANFLIRNTMTGLCKSPEERTHMETEVLHTVFTGIQKANAYKDIQEGKAISAAFQKVKSGELAGLKAHAYLKSKLDSCGKRFSYPTMDHWFLSYEVLDAVLKHTGNTAYYSCTSQVNQQAIRKTVASWKAYFKALKDWKKNPGKYQAKPRIPGYIREHKATAHFTNQVCRMVRTGGRLYLSFANCKQPVHIGRETLIPGKYVKTEIKPFCGRYRICITYEDVFQEPELPADPKRILGLDIGLENFLAGASNTGARPFLIRGGWLKSLNQWFNKRRAKLLSTLTRGDDSQHSRKHSHALDALSRNRNNHIRDFFYKAAHWVMRWCISHQIEVIVIGHTKGMKQEINIGKANNQNFVTIPYERFLRVLKTVSCKYGVPVVEREESYTSQASLLDLDAIPTYGDGDEESVFSGERIKRGLYRSSDGRLIHADINGAGNIARKEYPHMFDEMDMGYLCDTVDVVTGEKILNIKRHKSRKGYKKRKSPAAKARHESRKSKRLELRILLEVNPQIKTAKKQIAA
ncbi:MAG: hypothetical protein DBX58_06350 [Clostridiales bacterium]|nr:MAG: hypothetical protein DBX58_06350 [Clostridiales bacterium]